MKKRADGRYQGYITDGYTETGKPKRVYVYATTQRELTAKLAELRVQAEKGVVISDNNVTVEKWANEWLETYKQGVEYNTVRMYEGAIRNHIITGLGNIKLKDLKTHNIQKLINSRASEGKTRILDIIILTLKQMLKQAINNNMLIKNVADGVVMPTIIKNEKQPLTDYEKEIVIDIAQTHRGGAYMMTLLYTGIRRGEITALTWNDIDFEKNTITINKAVAFKNGQPYIKATKNYTSRIIPILEPLKPYLLRHKELSKTLIAFPMQNGNMMSKTAIDRLIESYLYHCNLKYKELNKIAKDLHITLHQFRHTYATMLYYAGVDLKTAQYLLGHKTLQMTLEVYTHLDDKIKQEATNKLNNFLGVKKVSITKTMSE